MAAVVVAPHRRSVPSRPSRPALQVIVGGRRGPRPPAGAGVRLGRLHPAVYRRRRLGAVALVALGLAIGWLAVLGARSLTAGVGSTSPAAAASADAPVTPPGDPAAAAEAAADAESDLYVVQPGDTLWSIARSLHPRGDLRPLVDQLADRVGGGPLVAGQAVRLDGLAA